MISRHKTENSIRKLKKKERNRDGVGVGGGREQREGRKKEKGGEGRGVKGKGRRNTKRRFKALSVSYLGQPSHLLNWSFVHMFIE